MLMDSGSFFTLKAMQKKISLLFLCTGNSCRSQMAEGWTRHLKGDLFTVYSAGIETHGLNPMAVHVMAEVGVDISGQKSQHIDDFRDVPLDLIITVCGHAHETCPFFPGTTRVIHVGFDDPPKMAQQLADQGAGPEEQLDCYRQVRDAIKEFILSLPQGLEEMEKPE